MFAAGASVLVVGESAEEEDVDADTKANSSNGRTNHSSNPRHQTPLLRRLPIHNWNPRFSTLGTSLGLRGRGDHAEH